MNFCHYYNTSQTKNPLIIKRVFRQDSYFAFFAFGAAALVRALNFSMRPAVSDTFSSPVKSGWHCEQISISMLSSVEPTITSEPHAHVAFAAG